MLHLLGQLGLWASGRPLLRPRLPPELLLNRLDHELHDRDVIRHAVQLEPAVKLFRDARRQLRPHLLGLRHLCRLLLRPRWPPRTTPTPATAANSLCLRGCGCHHGLLRVCAIFSATAFGGRPGPPGRHVPRVLLRRRRPFFGFVVGVEMPPSNDWMAFPTSSCTNPRMTVTKLFRLGMTASFGGWGY